jgi:hypothetical protein
MIDSMIEETLFIVKNLDERLEKVAQKQKNLDEKMEQLNNHAKTKIKKKLLAFTDIDVK